MSNRPTEAQKRELCERLGHWRPDTRTNLGYTTWVCRRCGDLIAKR